MRQKISLLDLLQMQWSIMTLLKVAKLVNLSLMLLFHPFKMGQSGRNSMLVRRSVFLILAKFLDMCLGNFQGHYLPKICLYKSYLLKVLFLILMREKSKREEYLTS